MILKLMRIDYKIVIFSFNLILDKRNRDNIL